MGTDIDVPPSRFVQSEHDQLKLILVGPKNELSPGAVRNLFELAQPHPGFWRMGMILPKCGIHDSLESLVVTTIWSFEISAYRTGEVLRRR